jgi:hypothetical protein
LKANKVHPIPIFSDDGTESDRWLDTHELELDQEPEADRSSDGDKMQTDSSATDLEEEMQDGECPSDVSNLQSRTLLH